MDSRQCDNLSTDPHALQRWTCRVLEKAGVRTDSAEIVAKCLINADLRGISSHGVARIPIYLKRIGLNLVRTDTEPQIVRQCHGSFLIDAADGLGHPVAAWAMGLCIERARETGVAVAGIFNSTHFGMAGYYAQIATRSGMIGCSLSNSSPRMAPWGARDALFGTNPLAIAVPRGEGWSLVLDMATSVAALGKILLAANENAPIPEGWALDRQGNLTTDAREALAGTVLPVGGPKGSGLALMLDILTGVLTGGAFGSQVNSLYRNLTAPERCGHFLSAINVEAFIPSVDFYQRIDRYIEDIKRCQPRAGVDQIYVPGEIEYAKEMMAKTSGLRLSSHTARELREIGEDMGIPFP